jgi:membrane-associated protease RseP (regulator of RpoE activity)
VSAMTDDETPGPTAPTRSGSWRRLAVVAMGAAGLHLAGYGAPVVALSVLLSLILLHETGHYLAARACGMRVHQFFVGFGPVLWSTTRGETEYGVKVLPLGGYVRIAGMSDADRDDPRGYAQSGRWQKLAVVAAGPVMNLVIALVVGFFVLLSIGVPSSSTTLGSVDEQLGAYQAGIRAGDQVVEVDGVATATWADVVAGIEQGSDPVQVVVVRDGVAERFDVPVAEVDGARRVGVAAGVAYERESFAGSVAGSVNAVRFVSGQALKGIGSLAAGFGNTLAGLTGAEVAPEYRPLSPVGAVKLGVDVGGDSLYDALSLVLIYSVFLAVFNLLPIPPLDGGHMLIVVIESVASFLKRRPVVVPAAVVQRVTLSFVVLLLGVGLVALFLDLTQPLNL